MIFYDQNLRSCPATSSFLDSVFSAVYESTGRNIAGGYGGVYPWKAFFKFKIISYETPFSAFNVTNMQLS